MPPELWRGVPGSLGRLEELLRRSAWSAAPAEGLVVRRLDDGTRRLAKLVRPDWHQIDDAG